MQRQVPRSDELKFINQVLTPLNPKDAYYVNTEELIRQYSFLILIGLMMVLYMVIM